MSLNDAPVLKPENYEKWKNNMLLHLEAISDEMIYVIKNGPIVIRQLKQVLDTSSGKERAQDSSGSSSETTTLAYEDKPREQWTSEDAKRYRLDGQARNIIICSTPEHIQCKLWGAPSAKVAWQIIEEQHDAAS